MKIQEKQTPGQGKLEFVFLICALAFAILGFIGLINAEWRGYVQKWLFKW